MFAAIILPNPYINPDYRMILKHFSLLLDMTNFALRMKRKTFHLPEYFITVVGKFRTRNSALVLELSLSWRSLKYYCRNVIVESVPCANCYTNPSYYV